MDSMGKRFVARLKTGGINYSGVASLRFVGPKKSKTKMYHIAPTITQNDISADLLRASSV